MGYYAAPPPSFGRRLRELRIERGLTLVQLGQRAHSSKSQIGDFEVGKRGPSPDTLVEIDRVLGAGGELIALAGGAHLGRLEKDEDGQAMRRRRVIHSLLGLAFGSAPTMIGLEALRHSMGHAIGTDAGEWDSIIAEYARSFYTTSPDLLSERLAVDVGVLQHLLVTQPEDKDLHRAAANLSMILAITLAATGQVWLAYRWWSTAREAADRSGDLGIRVMTRGQQVVKGLYDERLQADVIVLADETVALAGGRVCPGVAGVLAGRAQALAVSGRHREAEAAVRAVDTITSKMPSEALRDESMFGWPEHRLRHTESFVYTEIGATDRALAAQDRALSLYPASHAGNSAMVRMHRAACLIRDRQISEGLRSAADVLDSTPTERHQQLLYEVARRTLAAVPRQERQRSEFDDLRDRVAVLPGR